MKIAYLFGPVLVAVLTFAFVPACTNDPMSKVKEDARVDNTAPVDTSRIEAGTVPDASVGSVPDTSTLAETGAASQPDASTLADAGAVSRPDGGAFADAGVDQLPQGSTSIDVAVYRKPDSGTPVDQSMDLPMEAGAGLDGSTGGGDANHATMPFAVTPSSINLGSVPLGLAAPKQTITVIAQIALTDLVVRLSGPDVTLDPSSTCVATLVAGASCTLVVNFVAGSAGLLNDSVTISAGGSLFAIPITATTPGSGGLVITPANGAFSSSPGVPSLPMVFNVTNVGGGATGPLTATLSGPAIIDFQITQNTCLLLAPADTCSVSVVFVATASSPATEQVTLTIRDAGAGGSLVSTNLTGTVYSTSPLTITSGPSDLGVVLVGSTGVAAVFTVSYGGITPTGPLKVSVSGAEFVVTSDTCSGASLAGGGGCNVSIALQPTTVGAKAATLTVSDASSAPALKTLTGTGIMAANLVASPAVLDFGSIAVNSTTATRKVTIMNNGGSATGTLIFGKDGDFSEFPIGQNSCSLVLLPASTCSFSVAFAPTTSGDHSATFIVTDGAASVTIPVSGKAPF